MSNQKDASKKQQEQVLKELYLEYGLTKADVYVDDRRGYKIITRSGFEKIHAKAGVEYDIHTVPEACVALALPWSTSTINTTTKNGVDYKEETTDSNTAYYREIVMKGTFKKDGATVVTFASASTETVAAMGKKPTRYFAEMCEKRCLARGILKILGLYELGFFSEDEADSFRDQIKEARKKGEM